MLLNQEELKLELPAMYRVSQEFDRTEAADPACMVRQELNKKEIRSQIRQGARIALLVGSRGICHLPEIVFAAGETLREFGAEPFIIPSMGSHGGATAEGQSKVLESYGITSESMKMDILSSMDTIWIGKVDGADIYIDKLAANADMIVPIGRVKPHTDFHGPIESGLCKMLTIGLGNQKGCSSLHQQGFINFPHLIPDAARLVMTKVNVAFGLAIVENSYDRTYMIEAVRPEKIFQREPELLDIAREKMPKIMLNDIDVLVIQELGKDISGAGMDPNITGRTTKGAVETGGAKIQRIVVCALTAASHGNACGIGLADYILASCDRQVDWKATAINAISSGNPEAARRPVCVSTVKEGIICALKTCVDIDYDSLKIAIIKNTLDLSAIVVSEALLPEVLDNKNMKILGEYNWNE